MKNTKKNMMGRVALVAIPLVLGASIYTGCDNPDPQGELDKFSDRTVDDRKIPDMASPNNGTQVDFSGSYFVALTTTLSGTPILLQADVTVDEEFVADFVFQPLKTDLMIGGAMMPRPDARTPAGDEIIVNDVQLGEDGSFVADFGEVTVAGDANPLTGRDIVASIVLQGLVLSADSFCGSATGMVTQPLELNLAGTTFGAVSIGESDINDLEPVGECPASVNNNNMDMGTDGGDDMGGDMGEAPFERCFDGLEGNYDLVFKADLSGSRSDVRLVVEASADENCYTGRVESKADDSQIGTLDYLKEIDGRLTAFVPDFAIPPGASAALPNGGTASLELYGDHWMDDAQCGELLFSLIEPPLGLESAGGFILRKEGNATFTIDGAMGDDVSCENVVREVGSECDALLTGSAGTYNFLFKTALPTPTLVELELAEHPLTCLSGSWNSATSGDKLADVQFAEIVNTDQMFVQMRTFRIPAGSNPVFPDGALADPDFTTETLNAGSDFCGDINVNVYDPQDFPSSGTFAADSAAEPTEPNCP